MLKINGVSVKSPKTFSVDIEDLDGDSYRNVLGQLTRDRITTKRKLNCEWGSLTNEEVSTILTSVKDVFFMVEYPDPMEGRVIIKEFYVGTRSSPVYNWSEGKVRWEGLKMNFIEK
ncbi:DUF6711 family protein [Turicibacter sanguinis]|uniref:DUF6711 family protein n=1 Tax=Turicibacter sanguinis TaxID=154288 RepID=UPI0021D5114D|nr:DUF6711 family protein [Turicibacter sanguinis]MCU7192302.1 hypothetical protein [Turicibacter sanguinis]MCU7202755.1 hypothetical protein [Turicibacter sanguinis]